MSIDHSSYKHAACCAASCARYGTAKAAAQTAGRAAVETGMKRRATWWDEVRDDYTTIVVIITKL